jgi:hypothetical protein
MAGIPIRRFPMSTVHACGYRHLYDIDFKHQKTSSKWEKLATICISRSREALKQPTGTYTKVHRDTISVLMNAMLVTQGSIKKLLSGGSGSPQSVDALSLARLQVEGLFTICLLIEGSAWVDSFLRDGWKKQFVRYLLIEHETEYLPRFDPNAHVLDLSRLVKFRNVCSVSLAQMHTLAHEQTQVPMPAGTVPEKIPGFPTPSGVIGKLPVGTKRRMLERLHMDYGYLCSFAHGLQAANMSKSVYDDRSPERQLFSEVDVEKKFQEEVNTYARAYNLLSIAQAAAELMVLYPNDMELAAAVADAWHDLNGSTFFVNAVWNLRTKEMLGIVG